MTAAPVGDDAELVRRLRNHLGCIRLCRDAAARLEALARENAALHNLYADTLTAQGVHQTDARECRSQLAAAQACIVAADAIYKGYRIAIGTTGATHAYDTARRALDARPGA